VGTGVAATFRAVSSIARGRIARAKRLEANRGDHLVSFRLSLPRRQRTFAIFSGARRIFENTAARGTSADLVQFAEADTMTIRGTVTRPALASASLTRRALGTSGLPRRVRPNRKRGDQCQKTEARRASTRVHRLLP
jgi:hypothetical protein